MASSFKTIDPKDIVSTRNLLHEAIPITGTIISGTYGSPSVATNIKNYTHGMFQSVYDYPYLSSSANHIFDLTVGYGSSSGLSASSNSQNSKKINIYNEMAQVLAGFDQDGIVRAFDEDGDLSQGTKINEALFFNFTRLLAKDEVKKGSFSLELGVAAAYATGDTATILVTDSSGSSGYKVNSPAGEYGILFANNGTGTPMQTTMPQGRPCGLLYYQAGIAVLSASAFASGSSHTGDTAGGGLLTVAADFGPNTTDGEAGDVAAVLTGSAISGACNDLRHRIVNLSFNNTTELNSTIYFCRASHNDFNYSSNPTYLSASKMVVKNNSTDSPVSYTTAVGLYSADNELLAVAKLSEPLKKDPSSEFTLRVRLDY
tara:strand:- start:721 stop:1839 length:1119 start_codon:yes stop_codon:yes gene_type:complete